MAEQKAHRHHYIPQCYLRQWTGADRMLCEYQRPHDRILTRRTYTSQTGWFESLYSVESLPQGQIDYLERVVFARVDQDASNALDEFLKDRLLMTADLRSGWSRFLMSLMNRHPGRIAELWNMAELEFAKTNDGQPHKAEYEAQRSPNDPDTYEEYCAVNYKNHVGLIFANVVGQVCNFEDPGTHLNNMDQRILTLQWTPQRFMTSDNPLIKNKGLLKDDCYVLLPISPRRIFIATNHKAYTDEVIAWFDKEDMVDRINSQVIHQSYRFAYALCQNKVEFAEHFWPKDRAADHWRIEPGR